MKLDHCLVSSALALACASVSAAGGALDVSSGSAGFSSTPPAGGFSESFTFTLALPSFATASITSAVSGAQDVDFSAVFLTGPSGLFSFTQLLGDPFETWGLSTGLLAAGSYAITVLGINSPAIASYGGNLSVTPIPEPQTYALLAAGIFAIGFLLRRRYD